MKTKKEIIDKYEQEVREFSLCLLVSSDKNVYLSKRCNPEKDYFDHIQSTGRFKEKMKKGFKQFPDGKELEPDNNSEWYPYDIKELPKLKLTPSIEQNLKQIIKIIHLFETILRKILEVNGILANEVKITQEDNGIIIATYKKNTILIQWLIIYKKDHIESKNYLTRSATK
ncbi:hypothetical protein C2G38_2187870 [Gigaspora rosea]|uniref:Uncharacterized protein n=1 Tax=Gigaspora rosea TaxID=44941 RepID=A0A397V8J2_9GLOM|nr:hypothetical protein C2G38_2187870 [Gigaspora rosea]